MNTGLVQRIAMWGLVALAPAGTGCSSLPVSLLTLPAAMGACAYAVDAMTNQSRPAVSETPPRRSSTYNQFPPEVTGTRATPDASALLDRARLAYREFQYSRVVELTTQALSLAATRKERMDSHLLRGAAAYLLDDVRQARMDFRTAKEAGIVALDPRTFPPEMVAFFNNTQ